MKKILLFITLSLVALYAKPCMTDIYTLNGVNTSDRSINGKASEARENMKRLKKFMLYWGNPATRLDPQKNGKEYQFRYVYNPSYGVRDDMLETYYQLKESGQISEGYFTFILNLLTVDLGLDGIVEKYKEIISRYEGDAQGIYNAYNTSSFPQKHNLLLVAHSQGNLMGNKIYTMLSDAQKKKFRMISVGTPANHVMKPDQTAPYVTARNDFVINRVYDALTGNVDGIGHNFINVYLGSSFEARTQIALYVKSAYDNLMQTAACNDSYNTVYLTMENGYSTLTVLGTNREITPVTYDTLASFQLEQLPAEYDIHGNASCKYWVANHMCTNGINNSQCSINLSEREKGMILSPQDIADYKYFKLSMLHGDTCATVDIADGIYEVVRETLYN